MIKCLFNGLVSGLAAALLGNYRRLSIQLLKIEVTKSYVQGVRMVRVSVIGLILMGLIIALMCIGMVLFHVGLFVLLPWSVKTKALLGMILGLVYMGLGAVALRAATDEKTWMEKSGATAMLDDAIRASPGE